MSKILKPKLKHLLTIESLDHQTIQFIFTRAQHYLTKFIDKKAIDNALTGRVVSLMFFEPSTRTTNSFQIAARRLNAIVVQPNMEQASTLKGESLIDTMHSLEAMGTDVFVLRHPDNNTASFVASELMGSATALINAGDGTNEHPTQTLTDLFTIYQNKKTFEDLKIAIVGDVAHSRVARSLIKGLKIMGVERVRLIAPKEFVPEEHEAWHCELHDDFKSGVENADIIYALRIQKERMQAASMPDIDKYHNNYSITEDNISSANRDVVIMHPGPINRGIEIESNVADGKHSVIMQQVRNGVAVRMALLDLILN
ncbi:MAG: aspartate carbamoyltransferase catalytic subunit [Gammaproteobacteria bacterium]|nr:aspartate carbamoyltransferase catalytic subunit [Gammaproteobacteria bacterium]MCH9743699.1 aspartate carbamoyltransferase catalytic subunit [Gammaproteobacteria bacterium]